ncbi:amino acid ABC transporter ATP-binding protein, partial [bacterium]|nr:amino acid ABC transporter ATP-binding protein [bacterium]
NDAEALARKLLAMVGLEDKADAYPAQLSGGQKQRVAITRALAMEPEIMLFDEVTSALDPELIGEVLQTLRRIATDTDVTMLIVTHQMNFARAAADRVVFIDEGVVIEEGAPKELFGNPKQERTQRFLESVLEFG